LLVAVTGASGLVGANLCRTLLSSDHQVRALVRKDDRAISKLELEIVVGDILQKKTLEKLVCGVEIVFHAAAKISISGDPAGLVHQINVEGTRNILSVSQAACVKRFIHFSSIEVFDTSQATEKLDETCHKIATGSAYAKSKLLAEEIINAESKNLQTIILNPTGIIGPFDFKQSFMSQTILKMAEGKLPALIKGGFNWVDVRDVCAAAVKAATTSTVSPQYILSGNWCSFEQMAETVNRVAGLKNRKIAFPIWTAKLGLPFIKLLSSIKKQPALYTKESLAVVKNSHRKINSSLATEELAFFPRPLEDTILNTYTWLVENSDRSNA